MRPFKAAAVFLPLFLTLNVLVSGQEYRLPKTTEPIDYVVGLAANFPGDETSFTFEGSVAINVRVLENTRTITMHAQKLRNIRVTVFDEQQQPVGAEPSPQDEDDDRHFLVINLNREFAAGRILQVFITYEGQMEDDMYGWYRSWYKEGNVKKWLASTQFQATHARRALPCYDEPGYKVPFQFSFTVPQELHVLFNTELISNVPGEGTNMKRLTFARTPPMSSYLLAFVLSEFETLPGAYSVWSRRGNLQQTVYAQSIMGDTVNAMFETLLVPFETGTITKLDTVAVPDFSSGAMENWGLVTYREQRIQWEEGVSSERNKQSLASVVAHEIAHQWFGDLVSPAWWDYLWLNEGFATYFEFFACHKVEPEWRMDEQFVVSAVQDALRADGLLSSNPMTHEVGSPSSISNKFDTISYEKGGSVIRMMELFLGESVFRAGLNVYMNSHKLGAATDDDLFAVFDYIVSVLPETQKPLLPEDGANVTTVMFSWVRQAGYPVVSVQRNYQTGSVTFSQKRFLYSESQQSAWYVPLTMTSQIESNFSTDTKFWLTPQAPLEIFYNASADDWVLVNLQQSGFYRVNYDVDNWRLIAQELEKSPTVIPAVMRAQLVDDALNLARGGKIGYSVALDMTRFLKKEEDFIPWASALAAFSFLDDRLYGSDTYPLFQKYLRLLLENVTNKLGYNKPTDKPVDHVQSLHRNQIATWACNLGVQSCLDEADSQFKTYVSNSSHRVDPDMKSVVYCHGLLQGNHDDWNVLWERYLGTQTATEQSAILMALGCSNNETVLKTYLLKSIADNDDIRRQDSLTVLSSTYSRPLGLEVAMDFVAENFENITARYGGRNVAKNVVYGIASRLSTVEQITRVEEIFVKLNNPNLTDIVKSALESANQTVAWTNNNRAAIHDWLKKEVGASSVATLSVLLLAACFVGLTAL